MKVCNKCKEQKDYSEFAKDKTKKDGYNSCCRECDSKRKKDIKFSPKQTVLLDALKRCTHCKVEKPYFEFGKDRTRGDGYDNKCKDCAREISKITNPLRVEYRKERYEKWRLLNPKTERVKLTEEQKKEHQMRWLKKAMQRNNKKWRMMPFDECKEKADQCKSRYEYCRKFSDYYNGARINGWLSIFFPLHNTHIKRVIYSYVFPDNAVYVGLTGNKHGRHKDHQVQKNSAVRLYMDQTGLTPELNYLTDELSEEKAANKEKQYVDRYKRKGYKIINRVKAGGLGGYYSKHSIDSAIEVAKKCRSRNQLSETDYSAYKLLKNNNLLDEVLPLLQIQKPSGYWTFEKCKEVADKCRSRSEFKKRYSSSFKSAERNNWLDDIIPSYNYLTRRGFEKVSVR